MDFFYCLKLFYEFYDLTQHFYGFFIEFFFEFQIMNLNPPTYQRLIKSKHLFSVPTDDRGGVPRKCH